MVNIAQLIGSHSSTNPQKTAVRHNKDSITYLDLHVSSNQVASYLQAENYAEGDIIAVAMDRSVYMTACFLAIMKAGATYLPIDPNLPRDRIDFMLKDSGCKALFTTKKYAESFQKQANVVLFDEVWTKRAEYSADFPEKELLGNIAYILYTSGSTGVPKGVTLLHRNLLNLLLSVQKEPGISAKDKVLGITTISFDISELEIFGPLISGAELVILDTDVVKDGRALTEFIAAENITIVQATPFTWRTMLEYGWNTKLAIKSFCGGEAMTRDLANKLLDRCNEVWNMYGPTETTIYSIIKRVAKDDKPITIGKPIANTQVYLLDENLKQVAKGEVGEIYIGGAGVAPGYINRPELTAERFINNKFSKKPGEKIYKTGDLGKIVENDEILCLGRVDHQIKIRGFRIEAEEIEVQLKEQKKIKDALVVVFEDSVQNLRLVAYLVPESILSNSDIKAAKNKLAKVLPDYMVPTDYVVIPFIPVMTNGKVDRKALPNPELGSNIAEYVAPKTDLEKSITKIWIDNIGVKNIGTNDNFFNLGGNSLLAAKTMTQIETLTGKRLSLANLFKFPTIKQLASLIDDPAFSPYKSLIDIKPAGSKIPLYIVHGIGLNLLNFRSMVFNLDPDQPVYGLQSLGLNNKTEPLDSIEEIAAAYNSEILADNPDGPYAIAGYSFGGYIAYEMVKQLKDQGRDVKLLVMFDTNLQTPTHQYSFFKKVYTKALRQIPKTIFRIKSIATNPADNITYMKNYYERKFKGFYGDSDFQKEQDPENLPDFMQKIADRLIKAFDKYEVKPLDITLDLFKAKKRFYFVDDPIYLGWKDYALQGVNIHIVPGDHKEMFSAPNDAILAKELQNRLNEINN